MKMAKFAPLMFLLQVALIPRNISANPIASPGGMGATQGTILTEQFIKEGTDILTKLMDYIKENRLSYSQFDKSIKELENQIAKLPEALAMHRPKILEGLYKSQDRLVRMRKNLSDVANELKKDCETMIWVYGNKTANKDLLVYAAKLFTKRAGDAKVILNDALKQSIEIQDQLSSTKGHLFDFDAILDEKTNNIELKQKRALADIQDITAHRKQSANTINYIVGSCIFIIDTGKLDEIAKNKLETLIKDLNKQLAVIEPSQIAAKTLLGHVDTIKAYLETKIALIEDWKIQLQTSITDNREISEADILYGIELITGNLKDLIKACDNYLKHDIPDIISG